MALDVEEVRRIAELARLELTAAEELAFARQLSDVVDYIDQLQSFEVTAEDPESAGLPEADDVVAPGLAVERFLDNAPESLDRFLLVPRVKSDGQ